MWTKVRNVSINVFIQQQTKQQKSTKKANDHSDHSYNQTAARKYSRTDLPLDCGPLYSRKERSRTSGRSRDTWHVKSAFWNDLVFNNCTLAHSVLSYVHISHFLPSIFESVSFRRLPVPDSSVVEVRLPSSRQLRTQTWSPSLKALGC
jgi:hypothetical protein